MQHHISKTKYQQDSDSVFDCWETHHSSRYGDKEEEEELDF